MVNSLSNYFLHHCTAMSFTFFAFCPFNKRYWWSLSSRNYFGWLWFTSCYQLGVFKWTISGSDQLRSTNKLILIYTSTNKIILVKISIFLTKNISCIQYQCTQKIISGHVRNFSISMLFNHSIDLKAAHSHLTRA